jgi:hypothetical protein
MIYKCIIVFMILMLFLLGVQIRNDLDEINLSMTGVKAQLNTIHLQTCTPVIIEHKTPNIKLKEK